MAENIPPQKREVVVSGDRNCFYRAVSLWKDEISDEKQKKSLGQVIICREISRDFWVATFLLQLFGGSCQEQQNVDICASPLKRPICTYSSSHKKGFSF